MRPRLEALEASGWIRLEARDQQNVDQRDTVKKIFMASQQRIAERQNRDWEYIPRVNTIVEKAELN